MSSDWKTYALENVGKIVTGKTPPSRITDSFVEAGVPFVTPRDMDGRRWVDTTERYLSENGVDAVKNSLVPANSVAVSCIGSDMGKAVLLVSDSVTNQQINSIIVDEELFNPKFIYYILSTKQQELKDIAGGSATPILNKGHFGKFEILAPQKPLQDLIVQQLDSLDSKIELNRQTNQTLEHMAQAIFKSWFVDFEPTRAKAQVRAHIAQGRMPLNDGTFGPEGSLPPAFTQAEADRLVERAAMAAISGKSLEEIDQLAQEHDVQGSTNVAGGRTPEATLAQLKTTAALFPDALVDSELGEIPEGWDVTDLGSKLDVLETGKRPKGGVKGITEGVPSIGAENINGVGNYSYGKEKFVSREFFEKMNRGIIEDFDFLLYKDGGKPGDFKPRVSMFGCGFPYDEFAINEHVFRIRSQELGQPFLYFQIGHERVLADLRHKGAKAAIPGINQNDVKTINLSIPSDDDLLMRFNKIVQPYLESILIRAKENLKLADLRDALLPKLLSGELELNTEEAA